MVWAWMMGLGCRPAPTEGTDSAVPPAPVTGLHFEGEAPRNLLVLSLDTMRRDHMGRYDASRPYTPWLDQLAREGVALDDFVVCSNWTTASTACISAGARNLERAADRDMVPILLAEEGVLQPIPAEAQLATVLSQAGYTTALVTANGFFSRTHGNAQGFQTVLHEGNPNVPGLWNQALTVVDPERGGGLPSPFYLHVHFYEPHRAYLPPQEQLDAFTADLPPSPVDLSSYDAQVRAMRSMVADPPVWTDDEIAVVRDHMRARYAGEVAAFDQRLQTVWADLDRLGLLDDTLVMFWTDHGEALWEHGVTQHARLLHGNENDAIAFFWAHNLVPGPFEGPTASQDLAPTVLEVLGVSAPPTMTGHVLGTAPADRARFAFANGLLGVVQSVRQGPYKLHFQWAARQDGRANLALYDVAVDPEEQANLYDPAAPSETVRQLWSLLRPEVEQAVPYMAQDPRKPTVTWPEL